MTFRLWRCLIGQLHISRKPFYPLTYPYIFLCICVFICVFVFVYLIGLVQLIEVSFFASNHPPDIYDNLPLLRFMLCLLLLSGGTGRYICFPPILIVVRGFVGLLIYPPTKADKNQVSCAVGLFLKEASLSSIHGGGRHKLIHEVVKRRREQNMARMGQLTMPLVKVGVMMGGKK